MAEGEDDNRYQDGLHLRPYFSELHKEMKILKSGSYQLEISGVHASVDLSITLRCNQELLSQPMESCYHYRECEKLGISNNNK